jgi:hypothetical protein
MLPKNFLIALVLIFTSAHVISQKLNASIENQSNTVYKRCVNDLKGEMSSCTGGCGLILQSCVDRQNAFLYDKSEALYQAVIENPKCKLLGDFFKDQIDDIIKNAEAIMPDPIYYSDFLKKTYLYRYDSLQIALRQCSKK